MSNAIKLRNTKKKLFTETIKEANITYLDNPFRNEYMDMETSMETRRSMPHDDSHNELHKRSKTELTNCAYLSIKYNFKYRHWTDSNGFIPIKADWQGRVLDVTYPNEPLVVSSEQIYFIFGLFFHVQAHI